MQMKKMVLLAVLGVTVQIFAAVSVTNVVCRQRYPWNGLVDIDYEIVSDQPDAKYWVYPKGTDNRLGKRVIMNTLSGDGATVRHPACEPHSPLRYLRDEKGRKLTRRDVEETTDMELLKELGLPKQPVIRVERPSWVCIMRDPRHPPMRTRNGRLNQKFGHLKDVNGNRVDARSFFRLDWSRWHLHDFDGEHPFCHCKPSEIFDDALCQLGVYEYYADLDAHSIREAQEMTVKYLSKHGVRVKSLFPWPLYEKGEDAFLAVYKKPRLFDYKGCVWHHLRKFVPQGAVLAAYGTTWVYTTMRDFEGALRHANPKVYARHKASQAKAKASRFGGPNCCNGEIDVDGMYEVFFDEEDIKKIS